jgi:hypothetical protein
MGERSALEQKQSKNARSCKCKGRDRFGIGWVDSLFVSERGENPAAVAATAAGTFDF